MRTDIMPYKNHTLSRSHTQLDHQTLVSPSNSKTVSTCLNNDAAIRSVTPTGKSSPGTSVCQPRKTIQTSFNDAFTLSCPKTGHGYQPGKDFKLIKKHDVTTEEEFKALPINIQKKYLSTIEKLNFVQNSHNAINNITQQQVNLQQNSRPIKPYRSSTHHSALHYLPNNANLFPSSPSSLYTPSLAERRGKRLDYLNPQVSHSLEPPQSSGQKSSRSILSNQSPQLEKYNVKSYTRDKQYRQIITLDATGNVVQRKSPINYSHSLSPRETKTPSSDGSMASSYLGPVINMNVHSGPKNSKWLASNGPGSYSPCDWVEDKDLYLDFSLDEYHSNISVIAPKNNMAMRPSSRQEFLGNRSKLIMTSSPLSSNFEYLPSPHFRSRSRAQSLASLSKTSTFTKHDEAINAKDSMSISKGSSGQSHSPALMNSKPFKSIDSPKTIPYAIRPLSRSQNSISGKFFPNVNIKPKSAGATSNKDSKQPLDSNLHAKSDTLARKQRSYTISSTRLTSFSLDPSNPGTSRPIIVKKIDSPLSSGNNQMTLRMTLTRPDLRADESKIYAWQDSKFPCQNQYPADEFDEKFDCKGPFGGPDGWGIEEKQDSKVKKFWNKMTQNLKSPVG